MMTQTDISKAIVLAKLQGHQLLKIYWNNEVPDKVQKHIRLDKPDSIERLMKSNDYVVRLEGASYG